MLSILTRGRFLVVLAVLLAAVVVASGIGAHYPSDWLLENALVAVFLVFLGLSYRRLPLSRVSYGLIFLFLGLHETGAHWTYAEVPYDDWWQSLFGTTLNAQLGWQRNHFDRLVHFSYGLLLAYPVREVFLRVANVRGFWGYFLPLDVTMSTSMLYELIEWAAALAFGGDLGEAYLGTQGDVWDAHKDMALASLGALLAMAVTAAVNARWKRDFAREFIESLRVKHPAPLGEEELVHRRREARSQPSADFAV
jgi:putative membrane protein